MALAEAPIRAAATVVLLRRADDEPQVLMGRRGATAAFMASKFVFPGGAVDAGDASVPLAAPLPPPCAARLGPDGPALAAAAIRELWEETGLALGRPAPWDAPSGWAGFAALGLMPDAAGLAFIFRAITPPGRTRRFDARFFLAKADAAVGDRTDFAGASGELSDLHWVALADARRLDLPFITEVVLAEVAARLRGSIHSDEGVPFFDNSGPVPRFCRLG